MKQLAVDVVGLTGFTSITFGIYLHFGESATLIFSGSALVLWAILKSKGK